MSIKADKWIRRMAEQHGLIEPFAPGQVRSANGGKIVSYGTSSYGYDVRCADEFKIFTNINSTIVDPKSFDPNSFVDMRADVCIIPPNSFALARTVEYFRIPRNVLTVCLGKSTYARCFRGDTRVALADGTAPTLEAMARRHEAGETFWGYGIGPDGRVIVCRLEAPRLIGRDSLLEITLDNGEPVRATADHVFLLRDGRTAAAGELRVGSSLLPLYRDIRNGAVSVYQPMNGRTGDRTEILAGIPDVALRKTGFMRAAARRPARARSIPEVAQRVQGGSRNHKVAAIKELPGVHDVYCLTVPATGNFALEAGVFVHNCGIIVNVTPLEPEWEGHVTLEFSNTTPLPAKIYANEGVAQMLFFESDEVCETSYKDRGGKYQGQTGVTLPKT